MAHLDTVEQDGVGDAHAVLNLAANTNRHIGADLAVLADLGGGVHNDIALNFRAARERFWRCSPQRGQVQLQACKPQGRRAPSKLWRQHRAVISSCEPPCNIL